MERESKVKGQSREEEEKGRDKTEPENAHMPASFLSRLGVGVPGSLVLVSPDIRFEGQHEPGSVPEFMSSD